MAIVLASAAFSRQGTGQGTAGARRWLQRPVGLVCNSLASSYRVGCYTSGRRHRRIGCGFGFCR